jgi:hypothetical protein
VTNGDEARPSLRDWVWALARLRPLWPLPALLFLGLVLPFSPSAWVEQRMGREVWSQAELALVCSGAGTLLYWLLLLLSRAGMSYGGGSRMHGMREPSSGELQLVELGMRATCLLLAYAGPAFVLFAP